MRRLIFTSSTRGREAKTDIENLELMTGRRLACRAYCRVEMCGASETYSNYGDSLQDCARIAMTISQIG